MAMMSNPKHILFSAAPEALHSHDHDEEEADKHLEALTCTHYNTRQCLFVLICPPPFPFLAAKGGG